MICAEMHAQSLDTSGPRCTDVRPDFGSDADVLAPRPQQTTPRLGLTPKLGKSKEGCLGEHRANSLCLFRGPSLGHPLKDKELARRASFGQLEENLKAFYNPPPVKALFPRETSLVSEGTAAAHALSRLGLPAAIIPGKLLVRLTVSRSGEVEILLSRPVEAELSDLQGESENRPEEPKGDQGSLTFDAWKASVGLEIDESEECHDYEEEIFQLESPEKRIWLAPKVTGRLHSNGFADIAGIECLHETRWRSVDCIVLWPEERKVCLYMRNAEGGWFLETISQSSLLAYQRKEHRTEQSNTEPSLDRLMTTTLKELLEETAPT